MDDNISSEPRAKRQKKDKLGRGAALEKLRKLKGSKHKYEINDVDNVYEVVEENEYSKRVLERQCDDWIVDDNGSGYVEDGREIFDDDLDSQSIAAATKEKGKTKKKKTLNDSSSSKGNLRHMLSNIHGKKKEETKIDDSELLNNLLSELDNENPELSSTELVKPNNSVTVPKPLYTFTSSSKKQAIKDYMSSFSINSSTKENVSKNVSEEKSTVLHKEKNKSPEKQSERIFKEIQHVLENEKQSVKVLEEEKSNKSDVPSQIIKEVSSQNDATSHITESETIAEFATQDSLMNDDFDISTIDDRTIHEEFSQADKFTTKITEEQLINGWENMQESECNESKIGIDVESSQLPLVTNEEGQKVFRFFWWDAFEDQKHRPGIVYLFGKVYSEVSSAYVSCCVAVKNVQRKIYLLPRTEHLITKSPVSIVDVYHEFNDCVLGELETDEFRSKKVTKNYCFDPEVPAESEYLEVRYSAKCKRLEPTKNGKTFSRIFGTNSSFLEIFLLERKIKGPCWLEVTQPEPNRNPVSWCKFEIECKVSKISVVQNTAALSPPPLVVAALNFKTAVNSKNINNEIVMISCLIHNQYYVNKQAPNVPFQQHFCVFSRPGDQIFPTDLHDNLQRYKATRVQKMDSEKSLLKYFINQFSKLDPDLIVGHDLLGYQMTILSERLFNHKIHDFSKFGRIKFSSSSTKEQIEQKLFTGRLVCDIKISARELIKSRSFDLQTLCQNVLRIKENERIEIEPEDIPKFYQTSSDLIKLISFTMQDTAFILKMMYELNVIPLALQITNIAGNVMSRTLMGGRSERNEFLLLHAFNEKDYIVPDKNSQKKNKTNDIVENITSNRKKPTYSGGLVLEPKIGFYDTYILLMDFNSLYPSIIQEYNICFTTIPDTFEDNPVLPDENLPAGILPTEIRKLVESRREVKKLMNNPDISNDLRMQYNIRQMALKLTANSMYGCLGFSHSRFYAKSLAALVTHKGREILTNTRDLVQKLGNEVIYGDTDSLMINSNCIDYDQVMKLGIKIKQEVNKLYRQVELDIDGVFKYLLLLKKKKYAAVTLTKTKTGELVTALEYKGLDLVRRDWSQLAAEAGKFILNCIFTDQDADERIENIHAHLRKLKEDLEENKVPLPLLIITKQLTKDPTMYGNKQQLPHVQVALRYNEKFRKKLRAGDIVPYVICNDGTNASHVQRAYHVDELNSSENLKIDTNYYLAQQIHPVVTRLCEPIEGTDAYEIANCLGLEGTAFKKPIDSVKNLIGENIRSKEYMFKTAESFKFKCISCETVNEVNDSNRSTFLEKCANSACFRRPVEYIQSIENQLIKNIRTYITKYYANELHCEDTMCENKTVQMHLIFERSNLKCNKCPTSNMCKTYPERHLYTQLIFYQYLFDLSKFEKKKVFEHAIENGYNMLRETVEKYLKQSDYAVVNLSEMFSDMTSTELDKKKENKKEVYDVKILDMISEDEEEF